MKIALVGPAHPYKGGGARHTTELAHRLAAAGHDVIIESWRAQYPARLYPGQQTVDVPEGDPYPRTHRRLAWYRPDGWLAEGRRLRPADLVVFAYLTPLQAPSYLAIMAGLRRPARTAVICHNVLPHERRPGDVPLTRALLSRADTVITHSAAQAAQARDLAPAATVRTVAMPLHLPGNNQGTERAGLSAPAPTPPPARAKPPAQTGPPGPAESPAQASPAAPAEPPARTSLPNPTTPARLLFFGIVRPYKGLDVLLRALAQAPAHVTLTVAGEFWADTTEMDNLIAELGLADRVTLRPGYVPADEIPALFGAADALVMPYREATASQNALLAFAHGVPVITTTAGALAEPVRDGVDGLTCAPGDTEDLLRVLKEFSDPQVARRLRAGIPAVDPDRGWDGYLRVLLAG
jgi:glycosyltransferase involved in cell wall biosynthesis